MAYQCQLLVARSREGLYGQRDIFDKIQRTQVHWVTGPGQRTWKDSRKAMKLVSIFALRETEQGTGTGPWESTAYTREESVPLVRTRVP